MISATTSHCRRPGRTLSRAVRIACSTIVPGDPQLPHLVRRLDHPHPVHQLGRVDQPVRRQTACQREVGARREEVRVALDADQLTGRHERADRGGDPVERVHVRPVHQLLRVAVDPVVGQVAGVRRARRVLCPGEQVRWTLGRDQQALRRVERPRVVAGEVEQVRRVAHHERAECLAAPWPPGRAAAGPRTPRHRPGRPRHDSSSR